MKPLAMAMVVHHGCPSRGHLSTRGPLLETLLARVSGFRHLCAFGFVALMLAAPQAQAELVTYQFTRPAHRNRR